MFFIDRIAYFLVTRAKAVVAYLKKFTSPRYVIAFVIIYPHIYTNIVSVISAAQQALLNIANQFYSWIEAAFWGIYSYIRDKLQGIWFGEQIAFLVAGLAMAIPFLTYLIFRYALVPLGNALLTISLNILGIVYYIFCRVVIPALKQAYGAYLFAKFAPASYKYVAKALDRFAQGRFGGFVGAVLGALAPFSMFFIGPLAISIVTDPACAYAYAPLTIAQPYPIPYVPVTVYQYTLEPTISWLIASLYGQYTQQQPATISYIDAYISWNIRRLETLSYIIPSISFGTYYGPYYPGAIVSPTPALSAIYPSFTYSLIPVYFLYSISYIFPEFSYSILPSFLPPTYSYIFAEAPIFTVAIQDTSLLTAMVPQHVYAYIQDLSYLIPYYPSVTIYTYIQDLSYLVYL